MTDPSKFQFTQVGSSVPDAYEELLVPRIFRPWANLLLDQAKVEKGHHVLDIACGPGTVARLAAERVGPDGKVVGADISPEMLEVAKSKETVPGAAPLEFVESPAAPLNVPDASFDRVACQQGLQFFPDRVEALKEMRRALKPNGLLALAVWGSLDQCPLWGAMHQALRATLPAETADMMKAPFSLNDPEELRSLCEKAGLSQIDIQGHTLPVTFEEGAGQVAKCLDATPIRAQMPADKKEPFARELAARLEQFKDGNGVSSTAFSHIVLARP